MIGVLALSYAEARAGFVQAAEQVGASLSTFVHPAAGPDKEDLAVDVAEVGDPAAPAALLVVSGTHGIEGYAGSALQTAHLSANESDIEAGPAHPTDVRIVYVHALNPYGFAWQRRVNEDNVDLNRNFVDWSSAPPENRPYDELADLLVPLVWDEATQTSSTGELLGFAERWGYEAMQAAITGGQYAHAKGVFYGGSGPTWSNRWLEVHMPRLLGGVQRVGIIDLHTGLGSWGEGELIVHESGDHPVYQRASEWWGDVRSMRDGESVSAELSGDWLGRIGAILPDVEVTSAALEFGTQDPVTVLQALRADAWLHGHGDPTGPRADEIRTTMRAAFLDDDPNWMAMLTDRFNQVAEAARRSLSAETPKSAVSA